MFLKQEEVMLRTHFFGRAGIAGLSGRRCRPVSLPFGHHVRDFFFGRQATFRVT